MKVIKGSVTTPKGFIANGINCGIKQSKLDLALIASETPAVGAAVFTKNSVKAAPLLVSAKNIRNGKIQAIITNSGNANCFTGRFGYLYAQSTAKLIGKLLNISHNDVFVLSTGIIGKPLPFAKIKKSAKDLVKGLNNKGSHKAAKAILTTDLKPKEFCVQLTLGGKKVTIGANAKGSGMVAPNMATMLGHITTDAAISPKMLKLALKKATEQSFNCITVDGCMSTNDTVVVMANGLAKNSKIAKPGKDFNVFSKALTGVCLHMAKKIVLDAEGATKFIEINITGAKSFIQAKKVGLAIANSNLVKTAAFGSDPNWGRVAAAVGSAGFPAITEHSMKIYFSDFKKNHITMNIALSLGKAEAKIFTSDLSHQYIKINVEYN